MKLFGPTAELSDIAKLIMAEDVDALEELRAKGFNINDKIDISVYVSETPLILALCENKYRVLDWLLTHNVELNDKNNPAIIMACSNCSSEVVKLLIDNGADVNVNDNSGKTAMSGAIYGENYGNVSLLLDNAYDINNDGCSLRQAVSSQQTKVIELFIQHGVDVNFCKPDMVYPYNPSPVHIAVEKNDFDIVKLLVDNGADLTIKDKYGERPYNCAVKNKNEEMMIYIKSLEPVQWHNEEQKLLDLKKYKIPAKLLNIIRSENRRLDFPDNENVKYIVFSSLLELKEVNWNSKIFIDLLNEVDNYSSDGFLVWYPKGKSIAFADYEHDEFKEICNIKDFIADPESQINKILE